MGRERGYPLGACGFPCDADYEDGSVPLQLPLSCADHRVEARREGCHLREIERDPATGDPVVSVRTSSRPAELSSGPRPRRQALRLRRTAARLWGLTARRGQPKRHSCLDGYLRPLPSWPASARQIDRRSGPLMPT